MNNNKTIIQWNINGFSARLSELKILIKNYQPKILCLQETHLTPDQTALLLNYNQFRHDYIDNRKASGGVATYVHKNLYAQKINVDTALQAITVEIFLTKKDKFKICNIYIPPDKQFTTEEIQNITDQLTGPYILLGDLNTHTTLIGSETTDTRGKQIEHLIFTNDNLSILNNGKPTHFSTSTAKFSNIDITISTTHLSRKLKWDTHEDLCSSDHFPILIDHILQPKNNHTTVKYIFEDANWEEYKALTKINDINSNTLQERLDLLHTTINNAVPQCIPQKCILHKNKQVPWWNSIIAELIKNRKSMIRKYKKTKLQEYFQEYKKLRAKVRQEILKEKQKCWNDFTQNINSNTSERDIWSSINRINWGITNSQNVINAINSNGEIVTENIDIAEELAKYYANISNNNQSDDNYFQQRNKIETTSNIDFTTQNQCEYNQPFTFHEFSLSLNHIKKSAPGPDNIHIEMFQKLHESSLNLLLNIMNEVWKTGKIPYNWKECVILPIYKNGKNKLDPSSYRPISLTNHISKILERMAYKRLQWIIEKNTLLHSQQYGFRIQRSTLDCLTILDTDIKNAFAINQNLNAVFFDIEKAFDTTWRHKILQTLHKWGLRGNLPLYIKNFLTQRTFKVKVNGKYSNVYTQENGVPQGSVLSAVLFNIAINDITQRIPFPTRFLIYADDLIIYIPTSNINYAQKYLQQAVNQINEWGKENGLHFSTSKTKYMSFHRKTQHKLNLKINNQAIENTNIKKFLGLTFDEKLKWTAHATYLKNELSRKMNILKILSNKNTGSDRKTLKKIYYALIRSKLDYGCHLYTSAKPRTLDPLNIINNSALRIISGAYRTTPIVSIYAELGEPNLAERRTFMLMKTCIKIHERQNEILKRSLKTPLILKHIFDNKKSLPKPIALYQNLTIENLNTNLNLIDHILPKNTIHFLPPWQQLIINVDLTLNENSKQSTPSELYKQMFYELKHNKYQNYIIIYTDGSSTATSTTCAFINNEADTYKFKLNSLASNFTAEALAIDQALKYIQLNKEKLDKILIASDSLSTLKAIQNNNTQNSLIQTIQQKIYTLTQTHHLTVTLLWVPSHINIEGNELADKAAKDAHCTGIPLQTTISQDAINAIKLLVKRKRDQQWSQITQNKLRNIKENTTEWQTSYQSKRQYEIALTRLRTGHTKITHSYILKKTPQPICELCQEPITVNHMLLRCRKLEHIRAKTNFPDTIAIALGDDPDKINTLFSFLQKTGLLNQI